MKYLALFSFLAVSTSAFAQTAVPESFVWKLHLPKGSQWTQTVTSKEHTHTSWQVPLNIFQDDSLVLQNEVTDSSPTALSLRSTIENVTRTSKALPEKLFNGGMPSLAVSPYIGSSFTWKQNANGAVLDLQGINAPKATNEFPNPLPEAYMSNYLKACLYNSLPSRALSVGESYSYALPEPNIGADLGKRTRTLTSLDSQSAIFQESQNFTTHRPVLTLSSLGLAVNLSGDAARLYLLKSHRPSATATAAYVSKNGRVYYRITQTPAQIFWLDPPKEGIWLTQDRSNDYKQLIGYNRRQTGLTLSQFLSSSDGHAGGKSFDVGVRVSPDDLYRQYMTMSISLHGTTHVARSTGLITDSHISLQSVTVTIKVFKRETNTLRYQNDIQTTITTSPVQ